MFGALVALALLLLLPGPGGLRAASPARSGVASESRLVSQTALSVLKRGGTAADAMVAAVLAAGVVSPASSGLGGGGFALVYRAADQSMSVLDFRETAPLALEPAAYDQRPLPDAERGKLVGVPGEARGLAELHRRFGKLPWVDLVKPAERFARDGFPVESHLESVLAGKDPARFRRVAPLERAFWPGGKLAVLGQRVKRPELARTLHTLAVSGPDALYTGAIAADLVTAARQFGSVLTLADFARYSVRDRAPLRFGWEGYDIATMPEPSAGGVFLAEVLGSFSRSELAGATLATPAGIHRVAEVMRGALADRALYLGDPDVTPVDVRRLLAPARLEARKARVEPDRTQTVRALVSREHGTHALVVADGAGNVVSLTTTVNTAFGAEIAGATSGIVLNDELDDFTPRPASLALGVGSPPNMARPGVRPVSSMMPTIVLRAGKPVLAAGGSGGYAIPPDVTETIIGILARGNTPEQAVAAPRFVFNPWDQSLVLNTAYPPSVAADLEQRGETVKTGDWPTAVQVLAFTPGGVVGAADPRKGGAALVE